MLHIMCIMHVGIADIEMIFLDHMSIVIRVFYIIDVVLRMSARTKWFGAIDPPSINIVRIFRHLGVS